MIDDLFEHALDGVVAIDEWLTIVGWNPVAERLLGYTRDEVIGQPMDTVLVPPRQRAKLHEWVARNRPTGDTRFLGRRLDRIAMHKDGRELPIELRLAYMRRARQPDDIDGEGDIEAYVAFFRPAAGADPAWDVVTRAESRFQAFVEHASDVIACIDAAGRLLYTSPAAERLLGHRVEESIGTSGFDWLHPDDHELALVALTSTASRPGLAEPLELRMLHADGSIRRFEFIANNLLEDPAVGGIVLNARDVTERRAAEQEERVAVDRLTTLLDDLRLGVVVVSEDSEIVLVNEAFRHMFGLDQADKLTGRHVHVFVEEILPHFARPDDVVRAATRLIVAAGAAPNEVCVLADGRIFELGYLPIAGEDRPRGRLWLYNDVTEGVAAAQLLADQNERLRDLDAARASWVATVSHELRSPITAIAGSVELLAATPAVVEHEPTQQLVEVLTRNSQRLVHLVEDLLVLAALDGSEPALGYAPVDPRELCRQATAALAFHPRAGTVAVSLETEPGPPVLGDATHLAQLVDNLLGNALKFTHDGGHVRVVARPEGDHWLLEFDDDGIGIPAAELTTMFHGFARGSNARALEIPGTGLGLSIVKSIADLHHGTVAITSIEGSGTTVRVHLPIAPEVPGVPSS